VVKGPSIFSKFAPVCVFATISLTLSGCSLLSNYLTEYQSGKGSQGGKDLTYAWVPTGFTPWTKEGDSSSVAYKEMEKGEYTCDFTTCAKVKVVPKDGCSSLYVQANLVDAAGNNVGYANDMTNGVAAGQVAIMTLNISERSATGYVLNEINCR